MPLLGCATVNIVAQARGGGSGVPIGLGTSRDWSTIEWHRLSNDQSGAQLRIEGRAQCCDWASRVVPWEHEICVFYDGVRVWSGPVVQVHWVGDELRIDCKDRMEWLRRRRIHNDHEYGAGNDLVTIFEDVVADAMSVDPSPNITVASTATGILVGDPEGRRYLASQNIYANEVINELGRTGVEWTCIDRTVYARPQALPSLAAPLLRPTHFEDEPEALLDGFAFGTRFIVSGTGRGEAGDTIIGTNVWDGALEAIYGVHEVMIDEPMIRDTATAAANAQSTFDLYGHPGIPFYLLGGRLRTTAPVDITSLIPGTVFRTQSDDPCKPVPQYVRLATVEGSVGPEHQWVSLVFEPIGSPSV